MDPNQSPPTSQSANDLPNQQATVLPPPENSQQQTVPMQPVVPPIAPPAMETPAQAATPQPRIMPQQVVSPGPVQPTAYTPPPAPSGIQPAVVAPSGDPAAIVPAISIPTAQAPVAVQQPVGMPMQNAPIDPTASQGAVGPAGLAGPTVQPPTAQVAQSATPLEPQNMQAPQQPLVSPGLPTSIPSIPNHREPSKKLSMIAAVVFILFSIGMLVFAWHVLSVRKHNAKKVAAIYKPASLAKEEQKKVGEAVVASKNNTLDLSKTFNSEYSAFDQDVTAKIGQQVNLSNGLSFIVTSVEPWTSKDKYNKPDEGKKFIRVNITVGSRAEKRLASYDIGAFTIRENDGQPRSDAHVYLSGDDDLGVPDITRYEDGLDTGKSFNGAVVLQVKSDAKLHLVYKATPYGYPKDATDDDYSTQQMNVKAEIEL